MQNTCKCCAAHPRQQSTNVDSLGRSGLVQLLQLAAKKHNDTTMMKHIVKAASMMTAMMAMAETVAMMATVMAMVIIPLPLLMEMMSMTTTAVF